MVVLTKHNYVEKPKVDGIGGAWHTMEISAFPSMVGKAKALNDIGVD